MFVLQNQKNFLKIAKKTLIKKYKCSLMKVEIGEVKEI